MYCTSFLGESVCWQDVVWLAVPWYPNKKQSAAGTEVFTVGNNVKDWDAWRRHVEPADNASYGLSHMSVCFWVNPLTFYLDSSLIRCINIVISLYKIYICCMYVSSIQDLYMLYVCIFYTRFIYAVCMYLLYKEEIKTTAKSYSLDTKLSLWRLT